VKTYQDLYGYANVGFNAEERFDSSAEHRFNALTHMNYCQKRFNANACISPAGVIHKTCSMNHILLLEELTNKPSITDYLMSDQDFDDKTILEITDSHKWKDKMVHEKKWMLVHGVEYCVDTTYRVSCADRPTQASLDALFDLAIEALNFGDQRTYNELFDVYTKNNIL